MSINLRCCLGLRVDIECIWSAYGQFDFNSQRLNSIGSTSIWFERIDLIGGVDLIRNRDLIRSVDSICTANSIRSVDYSIFNADSIRSRFVSFLLRHPHSTHHSMDPLPLPRIALLWSGEVGRRSVVVVAAVVVVGVGCWCWRCVFSEDRACHVAWGFRSCFSIFEEKSWNWKKWFGSFKHGVRWHGRLTLKNEFKFKFILKLFLCP